MEAVQKTSYEVEFEPLEEFINVSHLEDRVLQQENIIHNLKAQRDHQLEAMRVHLVRSQKRYDAANLRLVKCEQKLSQARFETKNLRDHSKVQTDRIASLRRMV